VRLVGLGRWGHLARPVAAGPMYSMRVALGLCMIACLTNRSATSCTSGMVPAEPSLRVWSVAVQRVLCGRNGFNSNKKCNMRAPDRRYTHRTDENIHP
jgi:hypothetical protein